MAVDWNNFDNLSNESFSTLINMSGKQRMLSQRITMLILYCYLHQKNDINKNDESIEMLKNSISLFEENFHTLLNGSQDKGIPKIFSANIYNKLKHDGVEEMVNQFIKTSHQYINLIENKRHINETELDSYVSNAATRLLGELDQLTRLYEEEFHDYSKFKHQEIETQSKEILSAIKSIKRITEQTDMISINSKIIASRSGETGKQFNVVADRLQSLNYDIDTASDKIIQYLELLIANET